jgi:hypothetical protein
MTPPASVLSSSRARWVFAFTCAAAFVTPAVAAAHDPEGATTAEVSAWVGPDVPADVLALTAAAWRAQRAHWVTPRAAGAPPNPRAFDPRAIWSRPARDGALRGYRVGLSAGHGTYFRLTDDSGAPFNRWTFQRDITAEVREDIHTNQIAIEFLIPMLERAGAEVITMRERAFPTPELLLDNDDPSTYSEVGAWETSASAGFNGGTYRFAYTSADADAQARWGFTVSEAGDYPIYVHFLASANRARDARWLIAHADGVSERSLDMGALRPQSGYSSADPPSAASAGDINARWHYLGTFPMRPGEPYAVTLDNLRTSPADGPPEVVIADAVRVGAARSGVAYQGAESGRPRWEEAAIPFLTSIGAPAWVRSNDVVARPLFALYEGVDAFFSLHTNCCGGTGTSMYTWYPEMWVSQSQWPPNWAANNLPPGTLDWATSIHQHTVSRLQARWPGWRDRGQLGADFGELRPLRNAWANDVADGLRQPLTVPGALLEAAFHDTASPGDAWALRELSWRHDLARAIAIGMIRYFQGADAVIPPLAPQAVAAQSADRGVLVRWLPAVDDLEPTATPTTYRVYLSADGVAFSLTPALETADTQALLPVGPCEAVYARVTAVNAGGESLDSPTVGARQRAPGEPRLLWVNGIDRKVKTAYDPPKTLDPAPIWGAALDAAGGGHGAFAVATDDAVSAGLIDLHSFDAVLWSVGETSRRDGTLSADQRQALADFLAAGGHALLSGAEIGWDLIDAPSGDSARFLPEVMGAAYLSDDADSARVVPSPGGPFSALGAFDFGLCDSDSDCVEWPDTLGVIDPTQGQPLLRYEGTDSDAAVARRDPSTQALSITFGFPVESITDPATRRALISAAASWMLPDLAALTPTCAYTDPPEDVGPGDTDPTEDVGPGDTDPTDTDPADTDPTASDTGEDAQGQDTTRADAGEGADVTPPDASPAPGASEEDCSCQVRAQAPARGGRGVLWLGLLTAAVVITSSRSRSRSSSTCRCSCSETGRRT